MTQQTMLMKVNIKHFTNAYQWVALKKKIVVLNLNDADFYCIASSQSSSAPVGKKEFKEYITNSRLDFDHLDKFLKYVQSIRIVEFNEQEWENSVCNCDDWKKLYLCNHTIGVAFAKGKFEWPAIDMEIEGNRPKGRPKKVDKALTRPTYDTLTAKLFPHLAESSTSNQTTTAPSTSSINYNNSNQLESGTRNDSSADTEANTQTKSRRPKRACRQDK